MDLNDVIVIVFFDEFGECILFDKVICLIGLGDWIGLVGVNGVGKIILFNFFDGFCKFDLGWVK